MHTFIALFSSCPLALIVLPLLAGIAMLFIRQANVRYTLLVATALLHLVMALSLTARFSLMASGTDLGPVPISLGGLQEPDPLGTLFLTLASILFLAASLYAVGYLQKESSNTEPRRDFQDGTTFTNAPEQRFLTCLCIFLASISLVTTTSHFGVLWVGVECTTLSSAPLIYFHRHRRSLEATWKYLMICSVGIALALLGNLLLTLAFYPLNETPGVSQLTMFLRRASETLAFDLVPTPWLKAGFIFLLVGYGTKMGLAPLHNWLPDAHSQAPSLVSALLSGALLNCAFLGILRGHQIMLAAGLGEFSGGLLTFFGLLSMCMAAIFIVNQGHFKRLLAYSSVEHMGILALGVGLGGGAVFASLLHSIGHSFTKCMLFLLAGNVLSHYHTHSSYDARGMRWTMPITATLWLMGFLAITGSPPFSLFVSEFSLLHSLLDRGLWLQTGFYLTALGVIFVGMSVPMLRMVQGPKPPAAPPVFKENILNVGPQLILASLVLMLGLYMPPPLEHFLRAAAAQLGGM